MFKKKKNILFLKNYVEGGMTTKEFWDKLNIDEDLKNLLIKNKKRDYYSKINDYPNYIYEHANMDSLFSRYNVFTTVTNFLSLNKISYKAKNDDLDLILIFHKIQPSWLDIQNENYLKTLWENAEGKTKTEKIKWCKNKILAEFKFEKKPPHWLQNPEWPYDKDNKPLIFVKQVNDKDDPSKITYFFKDNNQQIISIEQYD